MSEELVCHSCERNKDKSSWGDGPWQSEPDHLLFEHAGRPCILHRNVSGAWCGYAAVDSKHPYYGLCYDFVYSAEEALGVPEESRINAHGGLTYSGACSGHICHPAKPGEEDSVWWFGFDCNHCYDLAPAMSLDIEGKYHTFEEVIEYTKKLAEQLSTVKPI